MGLLEERLYILGSRMVFFRDVEGADSSFEIFGVQFPLCLSDETGKRMGVQLKRFGTVGSCFLLVDLGLILVSMSNNFDIQDFEPPCSTRKPSQADYCKAHLENSYVCGQPP